MNTSHSQQDERNRSLDQLLRSICTQNQITKSQHDLAVERYQKISKFLSGSGCPLAKYSPEIYSQGSFRIGTTNRPTGQDEFDIDFVCEFASRSASTGGPDQLLQELYDTIQKHRGYSQLVEMKKRCVRLNYAGDFHMDILPAIPNPMKGQSCVKVPDRKLHHWIDSNPKGYAEWFEQIANGRQGWDRKSTQPIQDYESAQQKVTLRVVVQLMKLCRDVVFAGRDYNKDFAPPSIILTALAANLYRDEDSVNQAISSILNQIVHDIKDPGGEMLIVVNPTNPDEKFSEKWEQNSTSYQQFIRWIRYFETVWKQLQSQQGLSQIKQELEKLFGEDITKSVFFELEDQLVQSRRRGELGVLPIAGVVNMPEEPSAIQVKPNTFYGHQ